MPRIFVYVTHRNGAVDDSAAELATAALRIDPSQPPIGLVLGFGEEFQSAAHEACSAFNEVWRVENEALLWPNAEVVRMALEKVGPRGSLVLIPHGHFGIDLGPGLSIALDAAYVPDVLGLEPDGPASLNLVRQEYGGVVNTHVLCDISSGAVITIRPGAFPASPQIPAPGTVTDVFLHDDELTARRRFIRTVEPETGDVDITKHEVLVSVGRGIQEQDNIGIAEELAEAVGGAVSCSRPVVDAKWLDKSGKTVQPKVYLACGISGSFQHLAGLKGKPFIIAINKDAKAPIFRVADVGVVDDILEFLPELTEKVREVCAVH